MVRVQRSRGRAALSALVIARMFEPALSTWVQHNSRLLLSTWRIYTTVPPFHRSTVTVPVHLRRAVIKHVAAGYQRPMLYLSLTPKNQVPYRTISVPLAHHCHTILPPPLIASVPPRYRSIGACPHLSSALLLRCLTAPPPHRPTLHHPTRSSCGRASRLRTRTTSWCM